MKIAADNTITIIAPRAEMGQGISTTLAAFVAEELDVTLDKVKVEHGPASYAYFNAAMLEESGPFTFFDDSLVAETVRGVLALWARFWGCRHRRLLLDARRLRPDASGRRSGTSRAPQAAATGSAIRAGGTGNRNGTIVHAVSKQILTYGDVAADAASARSASASTLKEKAEWRLLGQSQMRVDMRDKVTGAPIFGIDVWLPDMLYATVG